MSQKPGWLQVILTMLGIIALYLILVYSGGASKILAALQAVTVNETFALQGGFQDQAQGGPKYASGTP